MKKSRVLSCIQPTGSGELHIGNYLGAIKNWVKLQQQYDCIYGIVDYHAITIDFDPKKLSDYVLDVAIDLLACGIDPDKAILFVQSHVPQHTELCWIFECLTSYGELRRMTQFKEKGEDKKFISAGLFNYPVLQAADILIYKADIVPVGQDQDQHLELTREIAKRFNQRFGEFFPVPLTGPDVRESLSLGGAKILSLADPSKKMSKSLGPKHYIGIMEPEEVIRQKIKAAVTDTGVTNDEQSMSPGIKALFTILELVSPSATFQSFLTDFEKKTLKYDALKEAVYENILVELKPIRERKKTLEADKQMIQVVLRNGAAKAQQIAHQTIEEVRALLGVGSNQLGSL